MLNKVSLLLRNLFFTVLHPGLVAGLIPYWILGRNASKMFNSPFHLHQYLGLLLFIIGLGILFNCIIRFAVQGRGTLSPIDPTKRLVVSGLYRYSRNPMYWGVIVILMGEAIFFQSLSLWSYLVLIFICFNGFIMFVEEPRLKRDFGGEYDEYCRRVGRWV
jgi:protein-S-isoprenylcysteine O-methyltransferase Ste14